MSSSMKKVKFDANKTSPPVKAVPTTSSHTNKPPIPSSSSRSTTPNRTTTRKSVTSPVSLNDLPAEEKLKVGRLVEKLIELGNKHEATLTELQQTRNKHQEDIQLLQSHIEGQVSIIEDRLKVKDEKIITLETKETMLSSMLALYQAKLKNMAEIVRVTALNDTQKKKQYHELQEEIQHFYMVIQNQKKMIDSFQEEKLQNEANLQIKQKQQNELLHQFEAKLQEEQLKGHVITSENVQLKTKNALLEHEVLTMQAQLQSLLQQLSHQGYRIPPANMSMNSVSASIPAPMPVPTPVPVPVPAQQAAPVPPQAPPTVSLPTMRLDQSSDQIMLPEYMRPSPQQSFMNMYTRLGSPHNNNRPQSTPSFTASTSAPMPSSQQQAASSIPKSNPIASPASSAPSTPRSFAQIPPQASGNPAMQSIQSTTFAQQASAVDGYDDYSLMFNNSIDSQHPSNQHMGIDVPQNTSFMSEDSSVGQANVLNNHPFANSRAGSRPSILSEVINKQDSSLPPMKNVVDYTPPRKKMASRLQNMLVSQSLDSLPSQASSTTNNKPSSYKRTLMEMSLEDDDDVKLQDLESATASIMAKLSISQSQMPSYRPATSGTTSLSSSINVRDSSEGDHILYGAMFDTSNDQIEPPSFTNSTPVAVINKGIAISSPPLFAPTNNSSGNTFPTANSMSFQQQSYQPAASMIKPPVAPTFVPPPSSIPTGTEERKAPSSESTPTLNPNNNEDNISVHSDASNSHRSTSSNTNNYSLLAHLPKTRKASKTPTNITQASTSDEPAAASSTNGSGEKTKAKKSSKGKEKEQESVIVSSILTSEDVRRSANFENSHPKEKKPTSKIATGTAVNTSKVKKTSEAAPKIIQESIVNFASPPASAIKKNSRSSTPTKHVTIAAMEPLVENNSASKLLKNSVDIKKRVKESLKQSPSNPATKSPPSSAVPTTGKVINKKKTVEVHLPANKSKDSKGLPHYDSSLFDLLEDLE